jgi:cell division septation protein DedD
MALVLMALSLMLGIRIERYQTGPGDALAKQPQATVTLGPVSTNENIKDHQAGEAAPPFATKIEESQQEPVPAVKGATQAVTQPISPKAAPAPLPVSQPLEEPKPALKEVKKTVPPPEPKPAQPALAPTKGRHVIQVSSSQDKNLATHQVEELKKKGFSASMEETMVEGKGRFYRVLIGPFSSESEAAVVLSQVKKDASFSGSYIRFLP